MYITRIYFDHTGGDQSLKQHEVHACHKDQVVEELPSFSSSGPTDLSPMEFEQPGDLQQSVMITRPSDHDLTSGIMDAPTITNFQVFEPFTWNKISIMGVSIKWHTLVIISG